MIDNFGTRHARSCLIAARERPRAGSKHMATFQAVAKTQSICLIAARERPSAGSKQMATYQAVVVAQTQSGSSSPICAAQLLHKLGLLTSLARSYTLCSSTGRGNLILSTNTSKTCVLLLFSVRTSNVNEYREQRSRILVPRSRISFSRGVIATKAC